MRPKDLPTTQTVFTRSPAFLAHSRERSPNPSRWIRLQTWANDFDARHTKSHPRHAQLSRVSRWFRGRRSLRRSLGLPSPQQCYARFSRLRSEIPGGSSPCHQQRSSFSCLQRLPFRWNLHACLFFLTLDIPALIRVQSRPRLPEFNQLSRRTQHLATRNSCTSHWSGTGPTRFWEPFLELAATFLPGAAERVIRKLSLMDSVSSSMIAHQQNKQQVLAATRTTPQRTNMLAATTRPKRNKTQRQRSVYSGPTARQDAEAGERARWLPQLAGVVIDSPAPMGPLNRGILNSWVVDAALAPFVQE